MIEREVVLELRRLIRAVRRGVEPVAARVIAAGAAAVEEDDELVGIALR